jgi:type I restriction enzyme S subunit
MGWARAKLDDVADVLDSEREPINSSERGQRIAGKAEADLFPYYGATGQVGLIDSYRSEGERVLLGEDGAPFLDTAKDKAYLVRGRFWVNNHAHVLRGAAGFVDNRFLCRQLNTVDYSPFVSGSTRLKLTSAAMRQIPLLIAPAAEQTRIVAKLEELLSDLDAGVAELKAAQVKLQHYRQSLLKAAVEGSLTKAWREANPAPEETGADLLARILRERRARWEAQQLAKFEVQGKTPPKGWQSAYPEPAQPDANALPALPQSWTWATLDALIVAGPQNGLYLPKERYAAGVPIVRIDDYQIGWHRPREGLRQVTANGDEVDTYGLETGDLVINRVNSMTHLGKSMRVPSSLAGAVFESNMMRLSLSAAVESEFVSAYLGSEIGRMRLTAEAKWAVNQASINQQDVRRTPVPIPPLAEQSSAVLLLSQQLSAAGELVAALEAAQAQSTAQRQNLLRAAFAGQLVPQDPADEPAAALLARIRAQRAAQAAPAKARSTRTRPEAA